MFGAIQKNLQNQLDEIRSAGLWKGERVLILAPAGPRRRAGPDRSSEHVRQ